MASSKISELTDGTNFEPGDATIIVRDGVNWKVDPTINAVNAWVNFDGTGTVAIRASYNVSSITDNGTGNYTVNFTNALTDANYCAQVNIFWTFSSSTVVAGSYTTYSTTQCQVVTANAVAGSNIDVSRINVAIIR